MKFRQVKDYYELYDMWQAGLLWIGIGNDYSPMRAPEEPFATRDYSIKCWKEGDLKLWMFGTMLED